MSGLHSLLSQTLGSMAESKGSDMVSKFPSLLSLTERPGESDDKPALAAAPFPAGYHHRYILQVIICDVEDPAPYLPSLDGLIRRALHPGDILSLTDTSAGLFSISQPFTIQRQGETPPSSAPAGGRITLWEALASSLSAALTTIPAFPSDHLEFLCLVGHSEESDAAVDDSAARRVATLFGAASTAKLTCVYLPPPSGPLSITQSQLQTVFHQPPHAHHACSDTTSLSVANALVLFRKSLTGAREAHITAKIRGLVPTIQSCSPSQSVRLGQPVLLSVAAFSGSTLSYQWYHNGDALPGVTSPETIIKHVSERDAGEYHCVVSNAAGTAKTPVITISIQLSRAVSKLLRREEGAGGEEKEDEKRGLVPGKPLWRSTTGKGGSVISTDQFGSRWAHVTPNSSHRRAASAEPLFGRETLALNVADFQSILRSPERFTPHIHRNPISPVSPVRRKRSPVVTTLSHGSPEA